jgi:hypothetical protein
MSVAHLPGCNLRHTPRQRCSSWPPPPEPPQVEQPTGPREPPRTGRDAQLGCLVTALALVALLLHVGAVLMVVAFLMGPRDFMDAVRGAPKLPSWAYPEGKVIERTTGCYDRGPWELFPSCRRIVFGSNSTLATIESQLLPEFTRRGWQGEGEDNWFQASAPAHDICVSYQAQYRAERSDVPDSYWHGYSARVEALVDDCIVRHAVPASAWIGMGSREPQWLRRPRLLHGGRIGV